MTLLERLKDLAAMNGATVQDDETAKIWRVYHPARNWVESGCRVLAQSYGNDCQGWKRDAYRDLTESIELGTL